MVVKDSADVLYEYPMTSEVGIRLFKHAPPGIVFDHFGKQPSLINFLPSFYKCGLITYEFLEFYLVSLFMQHFHETIVSK